ncbi:MAG: FtsQ-type POTRA domain-containing protein [Myxococcales bacterium]|nr:FtsQ-type POTRA domain-containing protein [Myxococcales bacterium]
MATREKKVAGVRSPPNTAFSTVRRVVFVVLLWGGLLGVGFFLREQVLKDDKFTLSQVMVRKLHRASEADVFERSGLRVGDNLFMIDIAAVERRLANSGWVRKAKVSRIFPSTIGIDIEEFQPVALAVLGELFYLDETGRAFRPYLPGEEIDLPVLVGLDREGYERGAPAVMDKIQVGLEFIRVWRRVFASSGSVLRTIEVGAVGLVSYTDQHGTEVFVGQSPWEEALEDARDMLREFEPASLATMYLGRGRRHGRITVKLRNESVGDWDRSGNGYEGGR